MTTEMALLVDKDGGRLSGHALSRAIAALAMRAEIGRVTLHQFRHSCASPTRRVMKAVARHPINEILEAGVALAGGMA